MIHSLWLVASYFLRALQPTFYNGMQSSILLALQYVLFSSLFYFQRQLLACCICFADDAVVAVIVSKKRSKSPGQLIGLILNILLDSCCCYFISKKCGNSPRQLIGHTQYSLGIVLLFCCYKKRGNLARQLIDQTLNILLESYCYFVPKKRQLTPPVDWPDSQYSPRPG